MRFSEPAAPRMIGESTSARHQHKIGEIAQVLLCKYYPPGRTVTEVWSKGASILQRRLGYSRALPAGVRSTPSC